MLLKFFDGLYDGSAHWASLQLKGAGFAEALVLARLEDGAGLRVEAQRACVLLHGQPIKQLQLHVPEQKQKTNLKSFFISQIFD